ncbi:Protein of unknown function [Cotesia congregata]|uniref:Uncharacterized protein n=1 Tax=Cotesia congregata TaxID=51543 RepID=A0A8J2EBY9_COTCN|nr:Protein of unknown function [Cotesia congregata]
MEEKLNLRAQARALAIEFAYIFMLMIYSTNHVTNSLMPHTFHLNFILGFLWVSYCARDHDFRD